MSNAKLPAPTDRPMPLHAAQGTKVTVTEETITWGYSHHKEQARKFLKVGEPYTVERVSVYDWSSEVVLEEIPGEIFNSVHFVLYPLTPKPLQVEGPTTTDQKIKAPFTSEQVKRLNAFQKSGLFHPFTCGNSERTDENHPDRGILVATRGGWVCPNCYYTQDWAHAFMVEAGAEATVQGTTRIDAENMAMEATGKSDELTMNKFVDKYLTYAYSRQHTGDMWTLTLEKVWKEVIEPLLSNKKA